MKLHHINDAGKERSLVLAITTDGAKILSNLHQVISSFKVSKTGNIYPLTNRTVNPQARSTYWPAIIVLGRETTLICNNQKNLFAIGRINSVFQMKKTNKEMSILLL